MIAIATKMLANLKLLDLPFLVLEPTSATHTHGHILYLISTNNCNSKISVALPTTVFTSTRSTPMLAIS